MAALVETMMSANNMIPWHRQGNVLDGYPTIEEATEKSGLTWKVEKRPLFDANQNPVPCFALCRDTDNRFYGTCSEAYHVYQNDEAFKWCRPLVESGEWKLETAGALKNGQTCWILLNQGTVAFFREISSVIICCLLGRMTEELLSGLVSRLFELCAITHSLRR